MSKKLGWFSNRHQKISRIMTSTYLLPSQKTNQLNILILFKLQKYWKIFINSIIDQLMFMGLRGDEVCSRGLVDKCDEGICH